MANSSLQVLGWMNSVLQLQNGRRYHRCDGGRDGEAEAYRQWVLHTMTTNGMTAVSEAKSCTEGKRLEVAMSMTSPTVGRIPGVHEEEENGDDDDNDDKVERC